MSVGVRRCHLPTGFSGCGRSIKVNVLIEDKAWSVDPAGLSWETFHSTGEATRYGDDTRDADDGLRPTSAPPEAPTAEPCCSAAGRDPDRNAHAGRCC